MPMVTVYPVAVQNSHRDIQALPDEWGGLQWERWTDYHIIRPGEELSLGNLTPWCEGLFDPGTGKEGETYDVTLYDPVLVAPDLLTDAVSVAADDDSALLAFVRRWGVPGVGIGKAEADIQVETKPQSKHPFESVWAVRRLIREVQRHFEWLRALREHKWRSPAVPDLWRDPAACDDAALALLPPPEHATFIRHDVTLHLPTLFRAATFSSSSPYLAAFAKGHYLADRARSVRPRDREEAHWQAFAEALTQHLRLVHPTIRWMGGRPVAGWIVRRPADAIWVQLWNLATGGAAIRQCPHCRGWFAVDHRGKVYCSRVCTNRASAKASYEARKARLQQRRKRRKR